MLNLFLRPFTTNSFGFRGDGLQSANMYTLDATISTTENWTKKITSNRLQSGQTWIDGQIIEPITYQITGITEAFSPSPLQDGANKFLDEFSKRLPWNSGDSGENIETLGGNSTDGDRANRAIESLKNLFTAPNAGTSTDDSRFLLTVDDGKSHILKNMTIRSISINKTVELQRSVQFVITLQEMTTFSLIKEGLGNNGNYVSNNFDPSTGAKDPNRKGDQGPIERGNDWLKKKGGDFSDKFL